MNQPEHSHDSQDRAHKFTDNFHVFQGLDMEHHRKGELIYDESYREDLRKSGVIFTDRSEGVVVIQVSGKHEAGRQSNRADQIADENEYATVFANFLGEREDRIYNIEPKTEEKGRFPDVWIQDTGSTRRVGLEITHFDEQAIGQLGRDGAYTRQVTLDEIAASIQQAIVRKNQNVQRKNDAERQVAAESYLLVISPYPIRELMHSDIAARVAALNVEKTFLETWVVSLKQRPFRVQ